MMHNRAGRKLRRRTSHRLAMFSNQLDSLMTHERIQTTLSKAKELRPLAERLITAAKNDGVAARRVHANPAARRATRRQRGSGRSGARGLPVRAEGQGPEEGIPLRPGAAG